MNFEHIKNIHFVGIGGIGMSGIAEILRSQGVAVSGCDLKRSAATDLLGERGIPVALGHDPAHLAGADLVVVTSAVRGENAEVEAARARGIRVMKRKELLGEIVNQKRGVDDPAVARLLKGVRQRVVTYGLGGARSAPLPANDAVGAHSVRPLDITAVNIRYEHRGSTFEVPGVGFFKLFVPGEHNVRNSLAAIAVARELGLAAHVIANALAKFLGVDRRFQILGDYAGALIVDDYAHHPTEIRATLRAARNGYPERRIVALFQPHLYSRTRDFAREFGESLAVADLALVAPIYAAREKPIEGITARMIADAAAGIEFLDRSNVEIVNELRRRLEPNDIFITMGAGDVHEIAEALVRGVN